MVSLVSKSSPSGWTDAGESAGFLAAGLDTVSLGDTLRFSSVCNLFCLSRWWMSCLLTLPFVLWTHTNDQWRKEQHKKWPRDLFKRTSEGEWEYVCFTWNSTFYLYISLLPVFCQLNGVIQVESVIFERVEGEGGLRADGGEGFWWHVGHGVKGFHTISVWGRAAGWPLYLSPVTHSGCPQQLTFTVP